MPPRWPTRKGGAVAERSGQGGSTPVALGGARNARRGPVELGGLTLPEPPTLRVDPKGVVMQANAQAAAMIGVPDPDRLGGVALSALLVGDEADLRLRRLDGTELPVRVVQTPVPASLTQLLNVSRPLDSRWNATIEPFVLLLPSA